MPVEKELSRRLSNRDTILTIGVFDGVHLGHQRLLGQLKKQAREHNAVSMVITFDPHPQKILAPRSKLLFLTDLSQRTILLRNEGVEDVVVLPFTPELARLSAQDFVGLLKKHLRVKGLVVGPDFTLGYAKEGDIDTLRKLGQVMDFTVTVVPPVTIDDQVVSSTSIRAALARGNLKKAGKLIGRPFRLRGRVISGASRGAKLGFPTANLEVDPEQALPAEGVYVSQAYINGEAHKSMTYIGKNPTFGGHQCTVEVYILDYQGDLYGSQLEVDLIERLRGGQQFATAEELKEQISRDVKQGREILNFRDKG